MVRRALLAVLAAAPACRASASDPAPAPRGDEASPMVGYDVRELRPRDGHRLAEDFERLRTRAVAEGKHVVAYFSADWCEACRRLDLELGNLHPAASIGHVRILKMVEEPWEAATRMNEFNDLRTRFSPAVGTYPLFVLLDDDGRPVEEMREAKARLEGLGLEPTVALWFESIAAQDAQ